MTELKFKGINDNNKLFDLIAINKDGKRGCIEVGRTLEWRTFKKIIHFTGLQDRNGKDIYEGDIIKQVGFKSISLIMFKNGSWLKEVITPKGARYYYLYEVDFLIKDNSMLGNTEVIGNIYENPELLEVNK